MISRFFKELIPFGGLFGSILGGYFSVNDQYKLVKNETNSIQKYSHIIFSATTGAACGFVIGCSSILISPIVIPAAGVQLIKEQIQK